MRIRRYVLPALVIIATGLLLPPDTYAGGRHHRHGHGHHYGDSFHIGLGFVFPLFAYGYPYYAWPQMYAAPVYRPPPPPMQRSYNDNVNREEPAYCREYTKKILIEGKEEVTVGTACLQGDGRWRIMN